MVITLSFILLADLSALTIFCDTGYVSSVYMSKSASYSRFQDSASGG